MRAVLVRETETIATFSVPSVRGMRVECVLHYVCSGSTERVCSLTMRPFRDEVAPKRRAGHNPENRFTVWIAKEPPRGGKAKFLLECTGCVAEEFWHSGRYQDQMPLSHHWVLMTGDVTQEVSEQDAAILFIGGEAIPFAGAPPNRLQAPQPFSGLRADKRMTVRQFAEKNKGTFFVITVRWYIADGDLVKN